MKKILLFLLIAFSIVSFSFGVDFGGYIENHSIIPFSNLDLREQINKLALWVAVSPSETVYITAQASVGYSYDEYDILGDLDYLYLRQEFNNFSYKLGRFFQAEFTGKVFAHRLDGLQLDLSFPLANFMLGAGYSGLLLKPVSTLSNTLLDIEDDSDDDVMFAPKKIILNFGVSFPEIFASQQLDIAVVAQLDMRKTTAETGAAWEIKGGHLNTVYTGLGLSGMFFDSWIYDVYGYLQLGNSLSYISDIDEYRTKPLVAFLAGGSVSYLMRDFYFSKIRASFMYASGDDDNISVYEGNTKSINSQFIPVSETVTGILFSPILSNLMKAGLEYSLKPFSAGKLKDFQAGVSGAIYFSASEGAVKESKVSKNTSQQYLGTEALLTLNYKPFSDFGITAAGGAFFPNTTSGGPIFEKYREIQPGVMINASFSF